ncbi:MAG: GNAT family N-acetyltransferase [Lachnospiraceae bacterium]|nr:GNAT family N-acetyltransferase [Lachnospiraceae bacterium]
MNYTIRKATLSDLCEITRLEAECFPSAEAAKEEDFEKRLKVYPSCFWLLTDDNRIIGMVNGMVSDSDVLVDEMYSDASLHNPGGAWQMIFGVETHPDHRGRGYMAKLLSQVIADVKEDGRRGIVLTCKDNLVKFYERFGFKNEGVSDSAHGGVVWYQMKLEF